MAWIVIPSFIWRVHSRWTVIVSCRTIESCRRTSPLTFRSIKYLHFWKVELFWARLNTYPLILVHLTCTWSSFPCATDVDVAVKRLGLTNLFLTKLLKWGCHSIAWPGTDSFYDTDSTLKKRQHPTDQATWPYIVGVLPSLRITLRITLRDIPGHWGLLQADSSRLRYLRVGSGWGTEVLRWAASQKINVYSFLRTQESAPSGKMVYRAFLYKFVNSSVETTQDNRLGTHTRRSYRSRYLLQCSVKSKAKTRL